MLIAWVYLIQRIQYIFIYVKKFKETGTGQYVYTLLNTRANFNILSIISQMSSGGQGVYFVLYLIVVIIDTRTLLFYKVLCYINY